MSGMLISVYTEYKKRLNGKKKDTKIKLSNFK